MNFMQRILDIREYDVNYHIRVQIDNEIRCSQWYSVELEGPSMKSMTCLKDKVDRADLRIMAFDIETTKLPLKFPDVKFDQVMMISYVIDGCGFLITNREVVGDDVTNFEYAPREDYDVGEITVFNEPNEKALLVKFFAHIVETKPTVFTTFNGDFFDWPFIQARSLVYNIKMEDEIGISNTANSEFSGRFSSHMDCLYWVKRDAYLP
jgi:DNA polymerase epsilon subunit 1